MSPKSGATAIEQLAANAVETRFENFDRETVEHAKSRIIDTLGCLIGGSGASGNLDFINLVREWGGKEEATLLIHGGKVPAYNAAMLNAIMARSFDFEPVSPIVEGAEVPGHISGTTIMTAITLGEVRNLSGKELIAALLVGDDTASRILAAEPAPVNSWVKWASTGTVNAFGATAIAGRILDLSREQMRNAFGITLNQLAGSFQMIWDGTTSFKLDQGTSARNGIFSAQLAGAGWTGPEDALFGDFGYYHLYVDGSRDPGILTRDLGNNYYSDGTFKPYPCCRLTHGGIDCALSIVGEHDIDFRDIKEITLYVPRVAVNHVCGKPFRIGSFPHGNAAFSFQYTIATALMNKCVKPEHFTEKVIRSPHVKAVIEKIKVAELSAEGLASARLTVLMNNGRELRSSCESPKGDLIKNPISKSEIEAKYWTNVDFSRTVPREKARKLLECIQNLEEIEKVSELVKLLVP